MSRNGMLMSIATCPARGLSVAIDVRTDERPNGRANGGKCYA